MKTYKSLSAELKLSYITDKGIHKVKISSSRHLVDYVRQFWEDINYYETFFIIHLNRANNTIGWTKISQGGISGTIVDPKIVFQHALHSGASGIVLAHNHPSGSLNPSSADISITKKLVYAGELLDIKVLDHIVVTEDSYLSFMDEGLI